jgi:phospholipid/cholesterol/gamma-HCH transport system permease protein
MLQKICASRRAHVRAHRSHLLRRGTFFLSAALPATSPAASTGWLARVGARAKARLAAMQLTLAFVGEVLLAVADLRTWRSMRWRDVAWQLEQTGPRSLPIAAIVSALVGLILAYMGAAQLEPFGAQAYIADLVTIGELREIAALVVGIVLSGRIGAAFAAQLASMRANEEIDALQTLGVRPVAFLVLPRLLALTLTAPLLTAFAAAVGMAAGAAVAVVVYDLTVLEYLLRSVQSVTADNIIVGLVKGTVYGVLVALAGCRQGLHAGRSAEAVGQATTAAVVQAIVWIAVAASVLTIIFQRLGI